ncbi:MAG: sporulation protein YqfD [Eubacteriales bacterium]|nr:sporulation protein YqfD [Eubacteriales bacterium]
MRSNMIRNSGFLVVKISGLEIERFINLCKNNGIVLGEIKYIDEDCCIARISRKHFLSSKSYVRKCRVYIKVLKKHYLRYKLFRYRKHISFAIGICMGAIIIKVLSLFLWTVSFDGNYLYTDELLSKFLIRNNIKAGTLISDIDCELIEENLRNSFNISWACFEIDGSKGIVHIKENYDKEMEENTLDSGDVTSKWDGEIYSIITRRGTPLVTIGSVVKKDDLLIDGTVSVTDDSETVVYEYEVTADADIYIKTSIPYSDEILSNYEKREYSGKKKKRYILDTSSKRIDIGIPGRKYSDYDVIMEYYPVKIFGVFNTDNYITYKKIKEVVVKEEFYTEDEMREILNQNLSRTLRNYAENGMQILNTRVNIEISENGAVCSGQIDVITPNAVSGLRNYTYGE